jgi:hypothetical protein
MNWETCSTKRCVSSECCRAVLERSTQAIVRALIDKQIPEEFRHIRSLKDVFAVQFSPNDKRKPGDDSEASQWMCPISFVEIGHLP